MASEEKERKKHEILDDSNYFHWAKRIKAALSQKRWWECIEPGYPQDIEDWSQLQIQRNNDALSYITQRVDNLDLDDIIECTTAKNAWEVLRDIHTNMDTFQIVDIMEELCRCRKTEEVTMREYIAHIISLARDINAALGDETQFGDAIVAVWILRGLKHIPKYQILLKSQFSKIEDLNVKNVKTILLFEERQDKLDARKGEEMMAYKSTFRGYRREDDYNDYRREEGRRIICFACNQSGHIAKYCPKFEEARYHEDRRYDEKRGRRESKYRTEENYDRRGKNYANFEGWRNEDDREVKEERKLKEEKRQRGNKKSSMRKAEFSSGSDYEEESVTQHSKATIAILENEDGQKERIKAIVNKSSVKEEEDHKLIWNIDSGASDHMTPYKDILIDFNDNITGNVRWGDGKKSPILGKGKVTMKMRNKYGGYELTLKEVYYAPNLDQNLMSERKFDENGFKVITYKGVKEVMDGKEIFLIGYWNEMEKMYQSKARMILQGNEAKTKKSEKIEATGNKATLNLWHKRFGHVLALPDVCEAKGELENCSTCLKGKSKRKPMPASNSRSSEIMEIVHSDVCQIPESSSNGNANHYFVTFLDDYSRYNEIAVMKRKNETMENFKKYMARAERKHGKLLKCLHSDNGSEYINNEFSSMLAEKGIERRLTVPYTPQQNGRAERLNQSLLAIARCMMIESGVPHKFWAEAILHANYIKNRTISSAINEVPFVLWNGRDLERDDLKHIKVFGCEAWVKQRETSKLLARAERCVYMGVHPNQKAYKLWHMEKEAMISAINVDFREEIYPFKNEKSEMRGETRKQAVTIFLSSSEDEDQQGNDDDEEEQDQTQDQRYQEDEENHQQSGNHQIIHEEEFNPRRSQRMKKPTKCQCCKVNTEVNNLPKDPLSVDEAMNCYDKDKWKAAMLQEVERLQDMETWKIVPRPTEHKVIDCKWVFRRKYNEIGEVTVHKARLVARGFCLTPGVDYLETYAPVVRKSSIRLLIALAVENSWSVQQLDVNSAYLNSELKETIYMEQPVGCEVADRRHFVCEVEKSIYGLPQSGRNWNEELNGKLGEIGMTRSEYDRCIYYNETKTVIMGIHVDDLIIIGNLEDIQHFKRQFKRHYASKDLGEASNILSIRCIRENSSSIVIHQRDYIQEILVSQNLLESKGLSTPLALNFRNEMLEDEECNATEYRGITGSLLHLVNCTRPDIAFATGVLCQKNSKPCKQDMKNAKHLLRYLKKTQDVGIHYEKTQSPLTAWVDADHANDPDGRKSITGFVITLAGGPISWRSRKQKVTTLSTNEAEYVALCEVAREITYFRKLIGELGFKIFIDKPTIIHIDNQGTIALANDVHCSERSKYVDTQKHFVLEQINSRTIQLRYTISRKNLADIFTKIICAERTKELSIKIGLCSLQD